LNKSDGSTNFLQRYFGNMNYQYMINLIKSKMSNHDNNVVDALYANRNARSEQIAGAFLDDINNMTVIKNAGGGNCFFIATADGINHYNHVNTDKITSGIYGIGNKIFTQSYLRTVVYNYMINSPDMDSYMIVGNTNTEEMNVLFENHIKEAERQSPSDLSSDVYLQIVNAVYFSADNFLVKKPINVPLEVNDYYKPFKLIERSQMKDYIESSNYWGDVLAVHAICHEIKLNIIIMSKRDGKMTIPYGNLLSSEKNNNWY